VKHTGIREIVRLREEFGDRFSIAEFHYIKLEIPELILPTCNSKQS